jgi:NAD(P)H-dependent flavin oxidoreductase YrpB (nitropropane dioxygenase family)
MLACVHSDLRIFSASISRSSGADGGVQSSALAIAVSNAGGLGSLPCAPLRPAVIRESWNRAQTSKPYNVNFFCHYRGAFCRTGRGVESSPAFIGNSISTSTRSGGRRARSVQRRGRRCVTSSSPPS